MHVLDPAREVSSVFTQLQKHRKTILFCLKKKGTLFVKKSQSKNSATVLIRSEIRLRLLKTFNRSKKYAVVAENRHFKVEALINSEARCYYFPVSDHGLHHWTPALSAIV